MILPRSSFERDAREAARALIGSVLVRRSPEGETRGAVVECEAYLGRIDDAAHSYRGKTERVRALYGPKGCAYVYLIYGMYWCLNISAGAPDAPECILLRALEPVSGLELMGLRRGTGDGRKLCSGPGKLCAAMDVTKELYGADLCSPDSPLFLESGAPRETEASRRIGIDYAVLRRDELWRYTAKGSPFVSRP